MPMCRSQPWTVSRRPTPSRPLHPRPRTPSSLRGKNISAGSGGGTRGASRSSGMQSSSRSCCAFTASLKALWFQVSSGLFVNCWNIKKGGIYGVIFSYIFFDAGKSKRNYPLNILFSLVMRFACSSGLSCKPGLVFGLVMPGCTGHYKTMRSCLRVIMN